MRILLFTALSLLVAGCASTPDEPPSSVEILEVKPRYIPEENFKRIGEYWSGKENTGKRVLLRTDPTVRDGFYFTLVLDQKVRKLPRGSTITGEVYTPASKDLQTYEFSLPSKLPKTKEIFIGLTGADWPQVGGVPSAWRFSIKDANGAVLATTKSYLWSM